jgi:hypothetical protein
MTFVELSIWRLHSRLGIATDHFGHLTTGFLSNLTNDPKVTTVLCPLNGRVGQLMFMIVCIVDKQAERIS